MLRWPRGAVADQLPEHRYARKTYFRHACCLRQQKEFPHTSTSTTLPIEWTSTSSPHITKKIYGVWRTYFGDVPIVERLVEFPTARKHVPDVRDFANAPLVHRLIEVVTLVKHQRHASHLRKEIVFKFYY